MENIIEDTTKRTIEEVYDLKDGVFIEAKEFFSRSEAEIITFRRHLDEAIQLNQPRFVCSHCRQMVKISGKSTVKGKVSFFSHLHDSDDCDIKTTTQLTKEDIEARKYGMVGESERHKNLKNFISTYLNQTSDISDVLVSKRIKSDIPYLNWRCPDVTAHYKGKKLVFELQLSTTFLSVIVDRDIFYRLNNYYVIWVFNFDNEDNKLTLDNLLAKDIYYANKRNVFILDKEAMEKSKKENKLYLSVQWLDENNIFVEKRLVALDDLSFDENSCKPYYYDADSLYYAKHPEEQLRVASLERSRQQVLDSLMKKKKDDEEKKQRIEEAQAKKREEMRQAGYVATPYMKGEKWGYEYNDTKLTLPIYTSASEISSDGYGYVVRNRRTGLVNQCGEEILPCQFKSIYPLSNGCFLVDEEGFWRIYNGDTIDKVKKDDVVIRHTLNNDFVSVTIRREKESIILLVRNDGIVKPVDSISDFVGITSNVTLKGKWKPGESWFNGSYWQYEKKAYIPGEKRLFTYNGYFLKETVDLSKAIIPAISFTGGVGLLNNEFCPMSPFCYSAVSLVDDNNAIVKKGGKYDGKYGLLGKDIESSLFKEIIPCVYDNLKTSTSGYVKVCNGNKWGVVNSKNETIVSIQYESIGDITDSKIIVKKNSRIGACDLTGAEIVEDKQLLTDKLIVGKVFEKYGLTDIDGETVLEFKYNSISLLENKCIKADNSLFMLNGELLCSNVFNIELLDNSLMICKSQAGISIYDKRLCRLLEEYHIKNISNFENGKAVVELYSGKKGTITKDGRIVPENEEPLLGALTKQKIMGSWGVKAENSEWLYPAKYDDVIVLNHNRIALVSQSSLSLINDKGVLIKELEDCIFDSQINESLIKVKSRFSFGIIDIDGNIIQECCYSEIRKSSLGLILTKKVERARSWGKPDYEYYGLLDTNGKTIITCDKRHVEICGTNIRVLDKGLHLVYNEEMEKLCEYYHSEKLNSKYIKISVSRFGYGKYNQWGVVNSEWELVVPCHFEEINILSDTWFVLKKDGKWGCVSIDLSQSYPCAYPNICLNENSIPSVRIGGKTIPCSDYVERKRLETNCSYKGIIEEIRDYGLMLKVESFKCLLHISEFKKNRKNMSDYNVGDSIDVLVVSFDKNKKRYSLRIK